MKFVNMQVLLSCILLLLAFAANAELATNNQAEKLYREGVLPSGQPLIATRENGINIEGVGAACVSCHRRSGLGTQEGRYVIPPIIGKYLFKSAEKNLEDMNLPHVSGYRSNRNGYTDVTLARAIRDGIDADGKQLNYLMPRFKLDDATMTMLISYLKGLTSSTVPGVTDDTLHFATIITSDADHIKRDGMLEVLNQFFVDKNSFIRGGNKPMRASKEVMYRVTRKWQLHVWELTGSPETWNQQLKAKLAAEPVYAVISGLGGKTWAPIHQFCEQTNLPCLFPNIDVPVVAENDFYPLYFSKGVFLEAELISHQLAKNESNSHIKRVVQVFREGDIGEVAAKTMSPLLMSARQESVNVTLKTNEPSKELFQIFQNIGAEDALVLWLRPEDIAMLPNYRFKTDEVYFSGLMAGLEKSPIPATWYTQAKMAYPFDLPEMRKVRMNFPLTWLKIKHIPIVDERIQSDTYLACGILAETLNEMLDSFVRDYLIERVEVMLSRRVITGYYPRLGLAPEQRFATKGGYIVHFTGQNGGQLVKDTDWVAP